MKDISKAGVRQCDLAPYSNTTLSSLVDRPTIGIDWASPEGDKSCEIEIKPEPEFLEKKIEETFRILGIEE